jgi:hypothetical protein
VLLAQVQRTGWEQDLSLIERGASTRGMGSVLIPLVAWIGCVGDDDGPGTGAGGRRGRPGEGNFDAVGEEGTILRANSTTGSARAI